LINCSPETVRGFYDDMQGHDRAAALSAFDHAPARVLVGGSDLLTPVHHSRTIAAGLPRSRLVIAPGAGHMLTLERKELVTEHLVDLVLAAQEGAATPDQASASR